MKFEDRGYASMAERGILDLEIATWMTTAAIAGSLFHRIGASSAASTVGGIGVATAAARLVRREDRSLVGAEVSPRIHLSLDIGEIVLTPIAAGLALALSSEPGRRKDAKVLFGTAALGAGATAVVLLSQSRGTS